MQLQHCAAADVLNLRCSSVLLPEPAAEGPETNRKAAVEAIYSSCFLNCATVSMRLQWLSEPCVAYIAPVELICASRPDVTEGCQCM